MWIFLHHFTILRIHIVNSGHIKGITIMLMGLLKVHRGGSRMGLNSQLYFS